MSLTGYGSQNKPIRTNTEPVHDMVIADMRDRKDFGIRKYGTPLQYDNNRDHLQDLYEELMDALVYVKAEIARRDRASLSDQDTMPQWMQEVTGLKTYSQIEDLTVRQAMRDTAQSKGAKPMSIPSYHYTQDWSSIDPEETMAGHEGTD